jgi:hypothetical protein
LRYVITGEWNRNDLLRLILGLFLVYVLFFWITNWILYFQKMTLDPATVVRYYRGDPEAEFGRPARPLGAMAEVAHFHVFTMGLLVLTLTHLLLFLPISVRWKASLVFVAFAAAILDEGAGWLVRFVHPAFAWLKVLCFLILQGSLLALTGALFVGVLRPARNAYSDSASAENPVPKTSP